MMLKTRHLPLVLLAMFCGAAWAQASVVPREYIEAEKDGHSIFIERNPKSEYYTLLNDFSLDELDAEVYQASIQYLKRNRLNSQRIKNLDLPAKWVQMRYYQSQFINYKPCDFMNLYQASFKDNRFLDYNVDGVIANQIRDFKKVDANTYTMQLNSINQVVHEGDYPRTLTIHILDKAKGVTVFEFVGQSEEPRKYLMVDAAKIRMHPIIVNECRNYKVREFDTGAEPTIEQLIQRSKTMKNDKK